MRIRTTTRPGASPHPISTTIAPNNSTHSDHRWAPPPPVSVYGGLAATPRGRSADPAPDAARTIPAAALHHATTQEEVSA